jgi:mono/diheme cytochrome c family protein
MIRLALPTALLALALSACGADTSSTDTDAGTNTTAAGKTLYTARCASCHGATGAGGIGPNITGSTTAGIGGWTDAQFLTSLRDGKDDAGEALCSTMPHYTTAQITDAQVADLFAYLKSLSSDTENPGTGCP